jgi:hypothetical protein
MRYIIDVTPGDYTTESDLAAIAESIRLSLDAAVSDVSGYSFPEYTFSAVGIVDETRTGRHARSAGVQTDNTRNNVF